MLLDVNQSKMFHILVSNTYVALAMGTADADLRPSRPKRFITKPLRKPFLCVRVGPHLRNRPVRRPSSQQSSKQVLKEIKPKSVRHEGVDERCERLGIKYLRWHGCRSEGPHLSHESCFKVLIDYVPRGQKINEDCRLCPKQIHPQSNFDLKIHTHRVHVRKLITIRDTNLLMCHCSNIRSQGTDRSARNRHWHCLECHHPFTTPAKLKGHMLHKHSDVYNEVELKHLNRSRGGPPDQEKDDDE